MEKKITEASFKKINKKLYLFIYFNNGKFIKYKVKDNYKNALFYLLTDITILDKYR